VGDRSKPGPARLAGSTRFARTVGLTAAALALGVAAWFALADSDDAERSSGPGSVAPGAAATNEPARRTEDEALSGVAASDSDVAAASPDAPGSAGDLASAATSDDERHALPVGLRGRVATADGEGVEGVALAVRFVGTDRARAVTDASGAFAFPADAWREAGHLTPEKYGWRFTPRRVRVRDLESDEARFVARPIELVPFVVRAVDRATDEPVPFLDLNLEKRAVRLLTDADGLACYEPGLEPGGVEVSVPEASEYYGMEHPRKDGAAEHELRVRLGPTYRLDLAAPSGFDSAELSKFATVLAPRRTRATAAVRSLARAMECGAPFPDVGGSYSAAELLAVQVADVRVEPLLGGLPWTRFESVPATAGRGAFELRLVGETLSGIAPVPSVRGIARDPIPIALVPAGRVEGMVLASMRRRGDEDGSADERSIALASRALRLAGLPAFVRLADPSGAIVREAVTSRVGAFGFAAVAPGDYVLTAESARGGVVSERISVVAGMSTDVELRLPRDANELFLAGELRSRSGNYHGRIALDLVSLSDPALRFRESLVTARGTRFEFRGVPPGVYELRVDSGDGLDWTPRSVSVGAPRTDVVLTCEDERPTVPIEFHLRDAVTGEPLGGDGSVILDDRVLFEETDRVAAPSRGRWIAYADGYRPATGAFEVADGQAELVIEAALRRGDGLLVVAISPWGEPLSGVEVLVDGAPIGVTDAAGFLVADRVRAERSIEARLAGWLDVPDEDRVDDANEQGGCALVLVRE